MVALGAAHKVPVVALLTPMDQPLGREVGNASEIAESLQVLRGEGPEDVTEIILRLGTVMLLLGGVARDETSARELLEQTIADGSALEKFAQVIEAQGGDPGIIDEPERLPQPGHRTHVPSPRSGVVTRCDALSIGLAALRLGAGRERKEDTIDPAVGITLLAKAGDAVAAGEPLATISWNDADRLEAATKVLETAWEIGDEAPPAIPAVLEMIR
jgi:thymidine phosphorylase